MQTPPKVLITEVTREANVRVCQGDENVWSLAGFKDLKVAPGTAQRGPLPLGAKQDAGAGAAIPASRK